MGCTQSSPRREIHGDAGQPRESQKLWNKQPNLLPTSTRKRTKSEVSTSKEIVKIREEINRDQMQVHEDTTHTNIYTQAITLWPLHTHPYTHTHICTHNHFMDTTHIYIYTSVQFSSVAQSCPTLCDPMNCSTPGLPVHHQLLEFTQTHVY